MDELISICRKLIEKHSLSLLEYETLISKRNTESANLLRSCAVEARKEIYGNSVFVRGLIEMTNYCKNDCFYCGIRRSNTNSQRYRLTQDEILSCCNEGYSIGFRTFVLQGGEDPYYNDDRLVSLVSQIHDEFPDCAITLSLGERSRESYQRLFDAGACRYLLRHETADPIHYASLHPLQMLYDNRMRCLYDLKEIGYQVGCGFMVGSPGQTETQLARDLKFIEDFSPAMCGIGPFIPQKDTPFGNEEAGSVELTLYLLSILRLIKPNMLIPATTALGTLDPSGREKGILSGANVVMPNLSPVSVRKKYALYDNKICTGDESAQCRKCLSIKMRSVGYEIVTDRGDIKEI